MSPDDAATMPVEEQTETMLVCTTCEVTWFGFPSQTCWLCDATGELVRPERLVLD